MDFHLGSGVQVKQGCAVTLRDQMWYFGNAVDRRQVSFVRFVTQNNKVFLKISKVVGCEMVRQSRDLPFDFDRGSCSNFEVPEEKVLMCFSKTSKKNCHL